MINDIKLELILMNINVEIASRKDATTTYEIDRQNLEKQVEDFKRYFELRPLYKKNIFGKKYRVEHKIILSEDYVLISKDKVPKYQHVIYDSLLKLDKYDPYFYLKSYVSRKMGPPPPSTKKLESYKSYFECLWATHGENYLVSITHDEYLEIFS